MLNQLLIATYQYLWHCTHCNMKQLLKFLTAAGDQNTKTLSSRCLSKSSARKFVWTSPVGRKPVYQQPLCNRDYQCAFGIVFFVSETSERQHIKHASVTIFHNLRNEICEICAKRVFHLYFIFYLFLKINSCNFCLVYLRPKANRDQF